MDIEVIGKDEFGNAAYAKLFNDIVGDIGKTFMIQRAKLMLEPEIPLFVFSVALRNAPGNKTIRDVAAFRAEGGDLFVTISNERYAPEVLSQLWKKYGRGNVEQSTRFDLIVRNAKQEEAESLIIASGEEAIKEILGAFWRALPEGIRVRDAFVTGKVVTVMAMEEILTKEGLDAAKKLHNEMIEMEGAE